MKILVGIDGSNTSREALKIAIKNAHAFKGELMAITSMTTGTADQSKAITDAKETLEDVKAEVEKVGLTCNTHLLIRGNSAGEDIVEFAETNAVDLIVVGVKRRSRVGKILMGSSAQFVILKAKCPVLSVK
ncbi:MAG: universal stress protein [Desulfobacterales bacterium]|nr:universal stress protein [Desulfobacterales bacterium]